MFSQVPVCPQSASWLLGHCSSLLWRGRYASYWNAFLLPPATKLGQGNIFRSVCQQFCPQGGHAWLLGGGMCGCTRGGMRGFIRGVRGFIRGACMVLFGGRAWFYLGGMRGFILGGMHGFIWGACMVLLGGWGVCGFIRGACMVLFSGGHAWFYSAGGACVVLFSRGACVVLFGGHAWFYSAGGCMVLFSRGGVRGFFSFSGYNEIRSMSGRYASYWNAFLFQMGFGDKLKAEKAVRHTLIVIFFFVYKDKG